jgi:DNA-binding Lrp family transcriptional regulator
VRARTTPDAAVPIAEALARRPDTTWVSITSGGTEIVCSTRARSVQDTDTLLLSKLPRTQRIVDVSAQQLLHVFYGYAASPLLKAGALSADQVQRLTSGVTDVGAADTGEPVDVDDTDRALLLLLATDGRTPVEELAGRADVPASTVRRRINALRSSGVLYFDIDFNPSTFETGVPTLVWLTVSPRDITAVGQALAQQPEVAFAAATTGRTDLYASLLPTSTTALYDYLTGPLAALPGVQQIETAPVIRSFKGAASHDPFPRRT